MVKVMEDVFSTTVVTREQKRRMGTKKLDAVKLLLRLIQNSAIFQCKQEMSWTTRIRAITTETFRDFGLHPKKYRFDETLERFRFNVEHRPHSKSTTNDTYKNEPTLGHYGNLFKVSPVVNASHHCGQNAICLETLEVDNAQQYEDPFEAWMKAVKKTTVNSESENKEVQKMLRLLVQLYSVSKKRSKKTVVRKYVRDMLKSLSDFAQSACVSHLIEKLDRLMSARRCRGGTSQKE